MPPCPSCASADVVCVHMQLGGGPIDFAHCRACEHRWWADPSGSSVELPQVLALASSGR